MSLKSLGVVEKVAIGKETGILAKIDTGADSSSVWASNISVNKEGVLQFTLFSPQSAYYSGKVYKRTDFSAAKVRSSNGIMEIRYKTHLPIVIKGRRIRAMVTLADRSKNRYPVLIGRRTIAGKFLVDTSKKHHVLKVAPKNRELRKKLEKDPHMFHKELMENIK